MFLPHKIKLREPVLTKNSKGIVVETRTYLGEFDGMVYSSSARLDDGSLGRDTKKNEYQVIIKNNDVKIGYRAELFLKPGDTSGYYIIKKIDVNYSLVNGLVDNIHFICEKTDGR